VATLAKTVSEIFFAYAVACRCAHASTILGSFTTAATGNSKAFRYLGTEGSHVAR
jgi:hypothetical protein